MCLSVHCEGKKFLICKYFMRVSRFTEFKECAHTLQKELEIMAKHVKRSCDSTDMQGLRSSAREFLTQDELTDYDSPWWGAVGKMRI